MLVPTSTLVTILMGIMSCEAFSSSRFAVGRESKLSVAAIDYLSSLSGMNGVTAPSYSSPPASPAVATSPPPPAAATPPPPTPAMAEVGGTGFSHATLSYFDIPKLTPKGPRSNADIGQPHDSTRKLADAGAFQTGSWWCAEGGWPSPALRATTEIFYVLSGNGCVTDLDGMKHYFGPGDTVVLPKGWSGRWDVLQDIHKVWFVYDHPNVEETSNPIRAVVSSYPGLTAPHLQIPQPLREDALGTPEISSQMIYNCGPTQVGCWSCTAGSFPVRVGRVEGFHLLEGVLVLTSSTTGAAQRCVAGDTVLLPQGWTGYMDVILPVRKLRAVVA